MKGFGLAPFGSAPFGSFISEDIPFIGNWSPFVGAFIGRLGIIQCDITNDYGPILDTRIVVAYPSGVTETVFTEVGGFTELYKRSSARKVIAGGHRWTLRRTTGWPSATVKVKASAADSSGNVATGSFST